MRTFFWLFALGLPFTSIAQSYQAADSFFIGGKGGWDYVAVHGEFLYVTHNHQLHKLNKQSGAVIETIDGFKGLHGIAWYQHKGFISDGRANMVMIINDNDAIIDSVKVGVNPDAIFFEPYSTNIIAANAGNKTLSLIQPSADSLLQNIALNSDPEGLASDRKGLLYVTLPDINSVAAIDLASRRVVGEWKIDAEDMTSLAVDNTTHCLYIAAAGKLVVFDLVRKVVHNTIPIGDGCDGLVFDEATRMIFTSNGRSGTMSIFKAAENGTVTKLDEIKTKVSGRTITLDSATHFVYIPYASLLPAQQGVRPGIVDQTFSVLALKPNN